MDVTGSKEQNGWLRVVHGAIHAHRQCMSSAKPPQAPEKIRPAWRRVMLWALMVVIFVTALHYALVWAMNFISGMYSISGSMTMISVLIISLAVYAILIAIPFMPGIEVGVALLLLQGASIAPFVYLATITGLMTAYLIGSTVPFAWLHKMACDLGLKRVCDFLDQIATTPPEVRLANQRAMLTGWLARLTVDYRYAAIGVLLNVPGTFAIGGGGGILMAAGLSRLFNGWAILLTLAIATLPVPLAVWIMGVAILG